MCPEYERLFKPLEDSTVKQNADQKESTIFSSSEPPSYTARSYNKVGAILRIISIIIFFTGFTVGVYNGVQGKSFKLTLSIWFTFVVDGLIFYGLSEIVNLVQILVDRSKS